MRWHVQGTDAVTGDDIELKVHEPAAEDAIKSANNRGIVVTRIAGEGQAAWRRLLRPVSMTLFGGCLVACTCLALQNGSLRSTLGQALSDQERLAQSVARAENTASEIRRNANLAASTAAQVQKLAEELSQARSSKSVAENQLTAAHERASDIEQDAARRTRDLMDKLDDADAKLADSTRLVEQLRADNALQARRMDELEHLPPPDDSAKAQLARLQAANKDLQDQIDKLKTQLLEAVARANAAPATEPADALPPPTPAWQPWALRITYDAARDYMALHTEQDSFGTQAVDGTDLLASTGVLPANALRLRIVHDRGKSKIYSATLSISLAADAPRDKAEENARIIADFLHTFIPTLDAPEKLAAAAEQAADGTRRVQFLTGDCKVTVWNDKDGLFTFQIAPARDVFE